MRPKLSKDNNRMKIKYLFLATALLVLFFSCKKDEDNLEPFDHVAQALKDDETIRTYLETHFYIPPANDEHFGEVKKIEANETPMINQAVEQEVNFSSISFKIYYIKDTPDGVNMAPTRIDSALVNYKGLLLDEAKTVFDKNESYTFWANLYGGVINGWTYALPNFNSGINVTTIGMPFEFDQTGKGIIIIPSGLAYRNLGTATIGANEPIMFHVEMALVKRNDQDRDGVKSIYEDYNGDGDNKDDDTDGDGVSDFIDVDDENDGILTIYESVDANGDGNPDDALDTDGDNTPNYLDSDDDGDGILTKDENADPDNNGNPSDAKDTDGDNIPDYLDAD